MQYSFPTGPILECKLSQGVTELHDANFPGCLRRVAQVEQEGMEPREVIVGDVDSEPCLVFNRMVVAVPHPTPPPLSLMALPVADSAVHHP